MTDRQLCDIIEQVRVACSQHRDTTYRLGAIYALDTVKPLLRSALAAAPVAYHAAPIVPCVKCGKHPASICQGDYDIMEGAYIVAQKELDRRDAEPAASPQSEAPTCEEHGTMVADDDSGRSWHCAACSAVDCPGAPGAPVASPAPHPPQEKK